MPNVSEEILFLEERHQYFFQGKAFKSVTQRINEVGFGPDFSRANPADVEYGKRRGSMVDLALVYHYENDLDINSVSPEIRGYVEAAFKFDRECPGKIAAMHPKLCVPALNVAGTPDLIRFISYHRSVIDWKTGVDNPLQTWMYLTLWNIMYPGSPCYARYGLKLNSNGTYKLKEHADPDDGLAAMAILTDNKMEIERWRPKYGHTQNTQGDNNHAN